MHISKNGEVLYANEIAPMFTGMDLTIGIDSSKSNTGIVVGDTCRNVLCDFEINGAGESVNVYDLCWWTRKTLKVILSGANVVAVGLEDIITKAEENNPGKKQVSHLDIHKNRAKITAVFDTYISFFQDNFDLTPMLINNQHWKAAILPEEYRKRKYDKGSKAYYQAIRSKWGSRSDDVTDAYCVWQYLCNVNNLTKSEKLDYPKPFKGPIDIFIDEPDREFGDRVRVFTFNKEMFDFAQLTETIASCLKEGDIGFVKVKSDMLTPEIVYHSYYDRPVRLGLDYVGLFIRLHG